MGHYASYSPGQSNIEALENLNDGFVVTGPGAQVATPVDFADTITVINIGGQAVRGTITPNPAFAATVQGNLSFLVPAGAAFQESFTRDIIQSVNFVAVDLPAVAGTTPVAALTANANAYQVAVKFVEA